MDGDLLDTAEQQGAQAQGDSQGQAGYETAMIWIYGFGSGLG